MGPPLSSADVAAVILVHNPGAVFRRVLEAVRAQTAPPGVVVVVDNGSTDGTAEWLARETEVEVVTPGTNTGVGAGHNLGWEVARRRCPGARAVWALEHDCVPQPDCLDRLIATVGDLQAEGPLAAVIPTQMAAGRLRPRSGLEPRPSRYLTFNGALLLVEALDEVGPLREDFFVGHEDKELSLRLRRAGYEIVKDRRARVEHANQRRPTSPTVLRMYYSRRNETYLAVHVRGEPWARSRVAYRAVGGVARAAVRGDRRWSRARARIRATVDGVRGDLGPKDYPYLHSER